LTGETGIGVDRERARLHDDRDDLRTPVGDTPRSNYAGDVGTSGVVGTTGLSSAGLSSTRQHEVRGEREGVLDRAGDKMREWKEDVKDTARDLRNEARERSADMSSARRDRELDREFRDSDTSVGAWADETRGDYGRVQGRRSDTVDEMGRDLKEAGRDIRDALTGRTGRQPHDIAEDRREAERRRRSRIYDRTLL
jgi:hypothetical protein